MSQRHQSSRRRAYGRRQHELTERRERRGTIEAVIEQELGELGAGHLAFDASVLEGRLERGSDALSWLERGA